MLSTLVEIGTISQKPKPLDYGNLSFEQLRNGFFFVDPNTSTIHKFDLQNPIFHDLKFPKSFCVEKGNEELWYKLSWQDGEGKTRTLGYGGLYPMLAWSNFNAWFEKKDHILKEFAQRKLRIRERVQAQKFVEYRDKYVTVSFIDTKRGFLESCSSGVRAVPSTKSTVVAPGETYFIISGVEMIMRGVRTFVVQVGWSLTQYNRQLESFIEEMENHQSTCLCRQFQLSDMSKHLFDTVPLFDIANQPFIPGISEYREPIRK